MNFQGFWSPAELIVKSVPTRLKWVWWIQRTISLSKPRRDSNLDRGSPYFTLHNMTSRFRYYDQTRVSMWCSMKLKRYLSETVTSLYRTHENSIQSLRFAFWLRSFAHLLLTVITNPLTITFRSKNAIILSYDKKGKYGRMQSVIFLTNFIFETNKSKQHASVSIWMFSGVDIFPASLSLRARRSSR